MKLIERNITGKSEKAACEDGIVINDHFAAVIDGSTSKSPVQVKDGYSNGRLCMELIAEHIENMAEDIVCDKFCEEITARIQSLYDKENIDRERLRLHPEERLTASAVIYSAFHRQIWMIGDCQCLVDGVMYDNPKPLENFCAEKRAAFNKQALASGHTVEEIRKNDGGRRLIIPLIIECSKQQNISYPVIDGFDIAKDKIKIINTDGGKHEIVLASDGYPFLKPTLDESEQALHEQLANDPLCIDTFKATKGLAYGNRSFDDRSYIRFETEAKQAM